jgi:hypothetical protein
VQVVPGDALEPEPAFGLAGLAPWRPAFAEQIRPSSRFLHFSQPLDRPAVQHPPAVLPRVRAHIHDPVGVLHHIQLVLHHEDRVALRLEPVEGAEQRFGVARVEAGRRLVQHVHHAEQIAVHLRAEPETLELAR